MSGGDELSIEELASNLSTYQDQLQQVRKLLDEDPGNSEYADMGKELVEVISLTEELLETARQSGTARLDILTSLDTSPSLNNDQFASRLDNEPRNMSDLSDKFPVGIKVQAVWSDDGEC